MDSTMFDRMRQAALERLAGKDPKSIAQNCGIAFSETSGQFHFATLGTDLTVSYPSYAISPALPGWHELLILHYLDLADGAPVQHDPVPFSAMLSGMVRGGGIDRRCEQFFAGCSPEQVKAGCTAMTGKPLQDNADYSAELPFLPRFPVVLKYWEPDEDFPASGRLFVDASADHYFTIEDAVTIAEVILEQLQRFSCK